MTMGFLILLPIAFGAGLVTALTPCILPVLPIVLAAGGTGGKRRPYAIVAGLVATFTLFTLAATAILDALHLSASTLTKIAVVMLLLLAATLAFPRVGEWLERPFYRLTRRRVGDLGGGFVLGASLGLVFVPCAGPVFGAVSSLAGLHQIGLEAVVVTVAYALGAAIPMLLLAAGSRTAVSRLKASAQPLRYALAAVMAVGAIAIYEGWETSLQTKIPSFAASIQNAIEGNALAKRELGKLRGSSPADKRAEAAAEKLGDYGPAPDFYGIAHWLNTPNDSPLTIGQLRGRVVLVDFWTYSCINCLRTLSHLRAWDARYRSHGLTIVGVHSPEFAFEHELPNVRSAVKRLGVPWPVALDNEFVTWHAYGNEFWPAEYLIDTHGHIRGAHFGEGDYANTEREFRALLAASGRALPRPTELPDDTPSGLVTPESYLGYLRLDRYAGSKIRKDRIASYKAPVKLPQSHLAYDGRWEVGAENILSAGHDAGVRLHFFARKVYIVLGGRGIVRTSVNGKPGPPIHVDGYRLYTAANEGGAIRDGVLDLRFPVGIAAYSFTFG
jgi:cytochrome c biogenesis protein CcdA/thiol-disulfide isomerase/thioredoxin